MKGIEHVLAGHSAPVTSVAISHDGTHVVSGSWDSSCMIWNPSTGKVEHTLQGH